MVNYREILRLSSMGISQRNIAFSCKCGQTTVSDVTKAAKTKGLSWPLPDDFDNITIREILYPKESRKGLNKAQIDFEYLYHELQKKGMTMTFLWNEYCEKALDDNKEPYMYSAFCNEFRSWSQKNDVRMHIEHKAGETIQTDWVGKTGKIFCPDTGEELKVYVFAACLPYSEYLYAEGFLDTKEEAWISAHIHAFEFFGGTTPIIVPDNCRTAVTKHTKEQLILNEQYRHMSEHYGCAIIPARPRKPKDKAAIEMQVGIIERKALIPLDKRKFFSLRNFNDALIAHIQAINIVPFQKREGSRYSMYSDQEKDLLIPLPSQRYEIVTEKHLTVNFNYHICFDGIWYSVPFSYVKEKVLVKATSKTVSIYSGGQRIALHKRKLRKGDYATNPDHMPENHRDFVEWNGSRFRKWASSIGVSTQKVIDAILASRKIEQQSYRSCRGVLALAKTHGEKLLEEACTKALLYTARPSYKTVKEIIVVLASEKEKDDNDESAYLRGSSYYQTCNQSHTQREDK